jgi:hypothetical protein
MLRRGMFCVFAIVACLVDGECECECECECEVNGRS